MTDTRFDHEKFSHRIQVSISSRRNYTNESQDMKTWIVNNCSGSVHVVSYSDYHFDLIEDAMAFKMMFGGEYTTIGPIYYD